MRRASRGGPAGQKHSARSKGGGRILRVHDRTSGSGRQPRHWIAAAEDKEPTLRITLATGQRAKRIRIAPARLLPRSPDFLTLPREIAVRINGGAVRTLGAPGGPRDGFELRLETAVVVQTLELRLVAREVAGKTVGIGEVELRLAAE